MALDPQISRQLAQTYGSHAELKTLFDTHSRIATKNPLAFSGSPLAPGLITDKGGDVTMAVDFVDLVVTESPIVHKVLNDDPAHVAAFVIAVKDIERAARNVGNPVTGLSERVLKRQASFGLRIVG